MTFSAATVPILGMYETGGNFPVPGPSAWPSGPATNMTANYFAMYSGFESDAASFISECDSNSLTPYVELEPWYQSGSTVTAILFSAITGGSYDAALEAVGTAIAGASGPVIVTVAHEMNIGGTPAPQYPWAETSTGSGPGGGTLTAAEWIAGWQYVVTKIRSTAAGNALFMWAPGAYTGGTTYDPSPYWPGSSYVDMVGIDGYPNTEYGAALGTFSGQFGPTVSIIRGLGWTGPVFISETNLAAMVASGGETITSFVADMYAAGISGVLEFEDAAWTLPQMTNAQWNEYNTAVAAYYGGGGSGGSSGGGTYTYAQTLYDGFAGSSVDSSLWIEPVNSNGISVSGGKLLIEGLTNYEQVMVQTTPFSRDLSAGIFGLQLSQSGTPVTGTMWFLGICDNYVSAGGNAYEFQTFPGGGSAGGAGSWYSWAFSGTDVSNDTGDQDILSMSVWNNGDWLGIGNYNLDGENDVHVYKSSDGVTWTEIASFQVTGAINESVCGFYFGTNYDSGTTGTSTYLATIDNVSWFARESSSSGGGGGGAGTFSLFGGATPSGGSAVTNTGTLGTLVESAEAGTLAGIAFYSPPGSTVLPSEIALYAVTGQALIASQTPTWSGAAGSGWVAAAFASPPELSPGTQYMAAVSGTGMGYYDTDSYWSSGAGASGITSGPLSSPGGTGTQGFYNPATSLAYPGSQYDSSNWWVDVSFVVAGTASSSGLLAVSVV